jgi:5'-nucleotidase
LPEHIDLIVSGINPNANLGHDVTYSGTVTAAMEAAISGLPAVAISLDSPENFSGLLDYEPCASVGKKVAEMVMQNGLPANTLLNVNVPYLPLNEMKGFCITRQGLRIYRDELVRRLDPRGRPYYWIGGDTPTGVPEDDTDFGALKEGYVSITPLQLDLTAHDQLAHLREWSWPKL